jgi:DNA (cytosine-5)-methyltransferase 1
LGTPVVSLCTGAGGLDIGLENAGFSTRTAIELDRERCSMLSANRPEWNVIAADIRELSGHLILHHSGLRRGAAFLIAAATPCQGFSKAAFWVPGRFARYHRDNRRTLLYETARIIAETRPLAFVLENVASLSYSPSKSYLDTFLRLVKKRGYTTSWKILNAAHYNVPQRRERLFVVGSRDGIEFEFPLPAQEPEIETKHPRKWQENVTCKHAIGDLETEEVRDSEVVRGKWGHLLERVPPGDNYQFFTKERGYQKPIFRWRSRYYSFLSKLSPSEP